MTILCLALLALGRPAAADGTARPGPEDSVELRVTAGVSEVELGRAFPITVVRRWREGLVPEAWHDEELAPLVVSLAGTTRRVEGGWVEETLRLRCWAFERGEVHVKPATLRAHRPDDASPLEAHAEELTLRVRSALGAGGAGEVELPGGLRPLPGSSTWPWAAGAAVLAALAMLAWWRHRARRALAAAPASPRARALARLAGLRPAEASGREAAEALYVEIAGAVRCYLAEELSIPAVAMTTGEVVAAARAEPRLASAGRGRLADLLGRSELVKFAGHVPGAAERTGDLAAATALVEATGADGGGTA